MKQLLIIICFIATTSFPILSMVSTDQKPKDSGILTRRAYRTACNAVYGTFAQCFAINCGIATDLLLEAIKKNNCAAMRFFFKAGGSLDTKTIVELSTTNQFPSIYSCASIQGWIPTAKEKALINEFLFKNINMVLINSLVCSCNKPLSFVLKHNANPNFIFRTDNNRLMCPGYLAIFRNDSEKLSLLLEHGAVIEPDPEMSLLAFALLHDHTPCAEQLVNKNIRDATVYLNKYSKFSITSEVNPPLDLQPYLEFAESIKCNDQIIQILNDAIEKQEKIKLRSFKSIANRLLKERKFKLV